MDGAGGGTSRQCLIVGLIAVRDALRALDETPFEGVTGASQLHLDRWRPISGDGTSAGAHIAFGLDRLLAACKRTRARWSKLSRDPRVRSAADDQIKNEATAMPCSRANRPFPQHSVIIPRLHCRPQRLDCACSSDSSVIPEFPILDHRAVTSRETLIHVDCGLLVFPPHS
jgi:hypothetical protein